MAKCVCNLPEELLKKLSKLGSKMDDVSEKILETGGGIVLDKVKSNLQGVLSGDSTGELLGSLGLSKVLLGKDGNHNIKVGFAEPRRGGKSNAMIANIIEYGKSGQPAKPFLKPAKSQSKKACVDAMMQKLEEEIDKL